MHIRWCPTGKAWRADVGPRSEKTGRRKPISFREIPNTDKGRRIAEKQLDAYLRKRDEADDARTEDAANPRIWAGLVKPYLADLMARVERDRTSEETYRSNRERLVKWCKSQDAHGVRFADRFVGTLGDEDGAAWVDWLARAGKELPGGARAPLSRTRIAGLLASVKACLNWGASPVPGRTPRVILHAGNPFLGIKVDAAEARTVKVATPKEVARFLRAARAEIEPWHAGGPGKDDWFVPGRKVRCAACRKVKKTEPCRRSHNARTLHFRAVLLLCRLQATAGTRPKELCTATWGSQVTIRGEPIPGWNPTPGRTTTGTGGG